MEWFLYDNGLRHDRVNTTCIKFIDLLMNCRVLLLFWNETKTAPSVYCLQIENFQERSSFCRCSIKYFSEKFLNFQENNCDRVRRRSFPINFTKLSSTSFFIVHLPIVYVKRQPYVNLNPSHPDPGQRKFLFSHFFVLPQQVL